MHPDWRTFLTQAGARIDSDAVLDFGDPDGELRQVERGRVLCDLSHIGLIAVRGADAQSFLQGQLCNDVRAVDANHSQLSAHCSPKGRMLASVRLLHHVDGYYLRLPMALRDALIKRLRLYVLRAKVTVEAADERWTGIGIAGPDADRIMQAVVGAAPAGNDAADDNADRVVLRVSGPQPRFEIYGDLTALQRYWNNLVANGVRPAGAGVWSLLDIRSGIATIHPETVEAFVPQMANLQLVGGVSFTKGCYPGQEIVARMQYLGKLKRRMYRVRINTDTAPLPGDALYSDHVESGQDTGMIVDAQHSPDGAYEALAVIQTADAESGPVHLGNPQGPRLERLDLPYPLDAGTQQQT